MPTPLAKGVIIAASVLVAAGIAAYENPNLREWLERSTQKLAMAIRSLGDELQGKPPASSRKDPSMNEDMDEKAEERRRQARAEIMERGRIMEERRKRRKTSQDTEGKTPSFDTLVDENGMLKKEVEEAQTTAMDVNSERDTLRNRHGSSNQPAAQRDLESSFVSSMASSVSPAASALEPWESQYEREMRNSWNITLPRREDVLSSHASESLIDLTPTTEDFPDPDYSVPSVEDLLQPTQRSQYFSAASSRSLVDENPEYYYAHPSRPTEPIQPRLSSQQEDLSLPVGSSAASIAGSQANAVRSETETDDDFSEIDDGVRTPASAWTELGSSVSGDM